ncbi:MAG TPA: endonuclease MutS2 [Syntrophomonadaceae bacterium]|nr:endonuclease MutS2 [Syntrophomonadaceae bacterium]
MDTKTLKKLEFDKIQALLCELTHFAGGFNHVKKMSPSADYNLVNKRLDETEEAMEFLRYKEPSFLNNLSLIEKPVKKARIQGLLTTHELLEIYHLLSASRLAQRNISVDQYKELGHLVDTIMENYNLEKQIGRAIDEGGTIRDDATSELRSIRSQINTYKNRIRDYLQSYIRSEYNQKHLQDALITERDGRYVIPVKQEFRNEVKGIIHDESASGATVFIEPLSVVEHNNKIRMLQLEEKREIEKILANLSGEVAIFADQLMHNSKILSLLDYIFARARLAYKQNAFRPDMNEAGIIEINRGKHPLIGEEAVPLNVELGKKFDTLVITGPNTGGKTVALKTIGLLSLMAMCGLFIPARENSKISIFKSIYVDIGDEQSIEQSLSTFSSHMKNIISILEEADSNSLVLLDELGAGTDPTEGAALARIILEELRGKKAKVVVSTHQSELKNYAYQTDRVQNACVEFDPVSLKPTYELTIGTPGQSNAFEIAARLGLKPELVEQARKIVPETDREISKMIRELKESRYEYNNMKRELELEREKVELERIALDREKQSFNSEKDRIIRKAQEETDLYLKQIRAEADLAIKELKATLKKQDETLKWHEIEQNRKKLNKVTQPMPKVNRVQPRTSTFQPNLGDYVFINSIGQKGYVLEIMADEIVVQAGILKINVNKNDVVPAESPEEKQVYLKTNTFLNKARHINKEIDLRGKLAHEAIQEVEKYLEDANLVGLDSVAIIHGKGTGALRKAVREYLKEHRYVKNYRDGLYNEGGLGVTIVDLH